MHRWAVLRRARVQGGTASVRVRRSGGTPLRSALGRVSTAARAGVAILAVVASVTLGAGSSWASRPLRASGGDSAPAWNPDPSADTQAPTIPASVSIPQAQAWLLGALQLRATQLQALSSAIAHASSLPSAVRNALAGDVATATSGIDALLASVEKDTTLAALRADGASMVDTYRVFSVVEPQVRLSLTAERQLAIASQIARLQPGLETAISAVQASKAATTLQGIDSDLSNELAAIVTNANAVVVDMLAQSPSDYEDATSVIAADAKVIAKTWGLVGSARDDVRHIVAVLAGQS
jgi:hypothetical protein